MTVKLLFVCLGNICRSPSAEGIMNHLIEQAGLIGQIVCDSAGTSSYHIGASPDSRMTLAARQSGIALSGHSRQVEAADFEKFDLILAMDQANYRSLMALDHLGHNPDKVRLICSFCQQFSDPEVPDPYYGGADGFQSVIELLLDACGGLLTHITEDKLLKQI